MLSDKNESDILWFQKGLMVLYNITDNRNDYT